MIEEVIFALSKYKNRLTTVIYMVLVSNMTNFYLYNFYKHWLFHMDVDLPMCSYIFDEHKYYVFLSNTYGFFDDTKLRFICCKL